MELERGLTKAWLTEGTTTEEMMAGGTWAEAEAKEPGRDEGGRSQGGTPIVRARMQTHSGVEVGRSHGGALPGKTRETAD